MSFFGPRPEPPDFPPDPAIGWRPPIWDRPSEHLLGAPVAIGGLLALTPERALVLADVVAYPNGFTFELQIRANPMVPRSPDQRFGAPMFGLHGATGPRLGIEFADGSSASGDAPAPFAGSMVTLQAISGDAAAAPELPAGPLLMSRGGGGSDQTFGIRFWSWPLPPAGPMRVFVEWADQGVPETVHEFDATAIRDAAASVVELWAPPD